MCLAGVKKPMQTRREFIKVFMGIIDLLDYDKSASMIIEKEYFDQFIQLERICLIDSKHLARERLI